MIRRARSARHLASILKTESGARWVELRYHQEHRCYGVHWEGGPTAERMYELAAAHADEIPRTIRAQLRVAAHGTHPQPIRTVTT